MKTLSKLNINPEKVLKNDELKDLKGGAYWEGSCWVYHYPVPGCEYVEYTSVNFAFVTTAEVVAYCESTSNYHPYADCQCTEWNT